MSTLTAAILVAYVSLMFALGVWARRRIHGVEGYLVAGRRFSLPLSTATLFATWFGAGTMLATADEVRAHGLMQIALEALGPGGLPHSGRLFRRQAPVGNGPIDRLRLLCTLLGSESGNAFCTEPGTQLFWVDCGSVHRPGSGGTVGSFSFRDVPAPKSANSGCALDAGWVLLLAAASAWPAGILSWNRLAR